jgi:hypothetical protein
MATARELDHEFRMRKWQFFSVAWASLVRLFCVVIVCACFYFSVREVAGKQTFADIRFKAIADLKANRWFGLATPWGLACATTAWGAGERYLRKRHIKRVSSESSELQSKIDPKRRSSNLTKRGESSPEDI